MPVINACCFFNNSLETGSRRTAVFTWVIGICNIAIDIATLVRLHDASMVMIAQEQWLYFPPGIFGLICIELAFSVGIFVLGFVLLIGINQGQHGKAYIKAWVIGMILDRFYDVFLGVYIMSWIGGHRFSDIVYVIPEAIVIAVYWILNSLVLLAALLCVIAYWQDLMDDIYGKEKRVKYHSKMANIRQAALAGINTPFRSMYGSRLGSTMMMSHGSGSINPGYAPRI